MNSNNIARTKRTILKRNRDNPIGFLRRSEKFDSVSPSNPETFSESLKK